MRAGLPGRSWILVVVQADVRKLVATLRRAPRRPGCTNDTRHCDFWKSGEGTLRPPCCTDHLIEMMSFTEDLLPRHGILHWVDYGTLLGAVRDEALIPWDPDVDFGILTEDEAKVRALEAEVAAAGFHLDLDQHGVIRIAYSRVNNQHVDIFPWERDGDTL